MKATRTPDSSFVDLEDYPFEAHYLDVEGLRMHYVDEGDPSAAPVLMLHGEPTWSYLYRHMIPVCAAAGHRVIAPDLVGFGKSDKPTEKRDYSYQRHVDWMATFVRALDLRGITLFCQDWGSLIGLRVAVENEDRFERIVIGNGALPIADDHARPRLVNVVAFLAWRTFATRSPVCRRSGDSGQPASMGSLGSMEQALPHRVQRPRSHHERWRAAVPATRAGCGRAATYDAPRRALPARGRGARAGGTDQPADRIDTGLPFRFGN